MRFFHQLLLATFALFVPAIASAHVAYVVDATDVVGHTGGDFHFLFSAFTDPQNATIFVLSIMTIMILHEICIHTKALREYCEKLKKHFLTYENYLPALIRFCLGVALIGAGMSGALISPVINASGSIATLEIWAGFCLMLGFLMVPWLIVSLGLYAIALIAHPYALGNFEFVGLVVALFALGDSRPGLDDTLGISLFNLFGMPRRWFELMLRASIGITMMFLALYEKFLNPHLTELVVNNYHLTNYVHVSPAMWVLSAGLIEFLVGLMILIGFHTRLVSVIAFLVVTTTFFFFKEISYAHIGLFGVLSILVMTGGGEMSVDAMYRKTTKILRPRTRTARRSKTT